MVLSWEERGISIDTVVLKSSSKLFVIWISNESVQAISSKLILHFCSKEPSYVIGDETSVMV